MTHAIAHNNPAIITKQWINLYTLTVAYDLRCINFRIEYAQILWAMIIVRQSNSTTFATQLIITCVFVWIWMRWKERNTRRITRYILCKYNQWCMIKKSRLCLCVNAITWIIVTFCDMGAAISGDLDMKKLKKICFVREEGDPIGTGACTDRFVYVCKALKGST